MENEEKFIFFLRGPFSQWFPSPFICSERIKFNTAEQYMMYKKAILFKDEEIASKILASKSPREQKSLGRKVRGYDDKIWDEQRRAVVYDGNHYKFSQNKELMIELMNTRGATLVEVNPKDKIWGIGLSETDPRRFDRTQWLGQNLLGQILTKLFLDFIFNIRTS